ncbi:MAG: efflux RND transporter periplasmic adaptor subunit [Armatimonadota bacterium]|nr:efflux RND transporter periplasmic adaptor subunit [Armatimonadota bacterium]MDR7486950.1 efflux RND transporter periplasmic adaptor subunit [Armatimonadota bacterium]MDR7533541.1 efflux RND transporter periplasmic adaptor subunit [Armatimonadota bacterium]MDR7536869.1 efflux RND transporter periplasmic adaptor subunit [Armatimonadota bacterium]
MNRLLRGLLALGLLAVLALAIIGATQWIGRRSAAREAPPQRPRPIPLVRTAPVEVTRLVEQATLPGEVRASAVVDVTPRIAGRLGTVLVEEGTAVTAGRLVARLEDPELEHAVWQAEAALDVQRARLAQLRAGARPQEVAQAEAAVSQTEVALAQAERDLARLQQLFADGLVARAAVDRAQTDVELARARVRAAREQLALVRQGPRAEDIQAQEALVRQAEATLAQQRARLRELRIVAPISGIVTRVPVERGAVVFPQTVVATVATLRPVEVYVRLPETDLPRLRSTSRVHVAVDALSGRVFEGRIARRSPVLDAASRSVELVVTVPNRDLALRPGMFARATVVFDERDTIMVPSDAIVRRGETTVLFVMKSATTVEERRIRVGYVDGSRSEVLAGLKAGEVIVIAGQQGLRDGMEVRTGAGQPGGGPGGGPSGPGGAPATGTPATRAPARPDPTPEPGSPRPGGRP